MEYDTSPSQGVHIEEALGERDQYGCVPLQVEGDQVGCQRQASSIHYQAMILPNQQL